MCTGAPHTSWVPVGWAVDLLSSGVSLINTLLPDPPKPSIKLKNLVRIQCRLHRRRPTRHQCKFKPPHMQAKHSNFDVLGGWVSLSTIMPHVQSLLDCLVQPPSLAPMFVIYNTTCWYTLVDDFLLTHNPSQPVGFAWIFPSLAVQTMLSLSHSIGLWYHPSSTRIVSWVRSSFQALILTLALQFVSPRPNPILSRTWPERWRSRVSPLQIKFQVKGFSASHYKMRMTTRPTLSSLAITFPMPKSIFLARRSSSRVLVVMHYKMTRRLLLSLAMALLSVQNTVQQVISH